MRFPRNRTAAPLAALAMIAMFAFAPAASASVPKLKAHERCEVIGGVPSAGIEFSGKGFTRASLVDVTISIEGTPGSIDSMVVVADAKGRFGPFLLSGPAPVAEIALFADSIFENETATKTIVNPC
jgi:hypothetical protein